MAGCPPALDVLIDQSPILREAEQLPRDLSEIGVAGLEALSYIAADVPPPAEWRSARTGNARTGFKTQSGSRVRNH